MSFDAKITIIHTARRTLSVEIHPGEIIARAPLTMDDKEIYSLIESKRSWIEKNLIKVADMQKKFCENPPFTQQEMQQMTERAKQIIPERVKYYAEKIGVTYNKITIRCQRTRWGSCSANGNLSFNCILVMFPPEAMDCIIVHELCHRKHHNHSTMFYQELLKHYPDYKKHNEWLNRNGVLYLSRLPK